MLGLTGFFAVVAVIVHPANPVTRSLTLNFNGFISLE